MKSAVSILAAIAAISLAPSVIVRETHAGIIISNFSLTNNALSFDISGTFPGPLPADPVFQGILFLVNPNITADPGYSLGNFASATTASFTGTQALRTFAPVGVGNDQNQYGDYSFVAFENNFAVGDGINGSLTANWGFTAFDPLQVTTLNVFWGVANNFERVDSGTFLTSVSVVPEPSSFMLVGAMVTITGLARRRAPGHS